LATLSDRKMEKKINMAVPEAVDELGMMIQPTPNTRWFGPQQLLARHLLGASVETVDHHMAIPSVLEQYETSLRDPMFYQMTKRMIKHYLHWQSHLPHHTKNEVNFEGVEIKSIEMDKLVTYYEKFDADITNAVDVAQSDLMTNVVEKDNANAHVNNFVIWARNYRLNHMPFTVKINVNSNKAQKAVVQMFMATVNDANGHPHTTIENAKNYVQMDKWVVDLKQGSNVIARDCEEFSNYVKDRTPYSKLYRLVMQANQGKTEWPMDMSEAHCGFPQRMLLPRGRKGGMPFQFFFIVSPLVQPHTPQFTGYDKNISCGVGSGARYIDNRPLGWPFDRPISKLNWDTPNMYTYETMIYHKSEVDINSPLGHH